MFCARKERLHIIKSIMHTHRNDLLACLFIVASTWMIYWQVGAFGLATADDFAVMEHTQRLADNCDLAGAFTDMPPCYPYWAPICVLPHMVDAWIFGWDFGRRHLLNVVVHILNVLILFGVLRYTTRLLWQSAFTAALFALHPLNAGTVSWLTVRGGLLSVLFFMMAVAAYVYYTRAPGPRRYGWIVLFFLLGLMAKPEIVYLPPLLLVMDYWPLCRLRRHAFDPAGGDGGGTFWRLFLEKLPLFIIAAAWMLGAIFLYKGTPAADASMTTGFKEMLVLLPNLPVSYAAYVWKTVFPYKLAFYYTPYAASVLPVWEIAASLVFLTGITLFVFRVPEKHRYLVAGWLWYLAGISMFALANVALHQRMTDRYAYLPTIGLFIMTAWGVPALIPGRKWKKPLLTAAAVVVVTIFMVLSWRQASVWKTGVTLYKHTVAINPDAKAAHCDLGGLLLKEGRPREAVGHYEKAILLDPDYAEAHHGLGRALEQAGNPGRAEYHYREAVRIDPEYVTGHNNLGNLLLARGAVDEAIGHFEAALRISPRSETLHNNIATALIQKGRTAEAVRHLSIALQINPSYRTARENLYRLRATVDGEPAAEGE